MGTPVNRVCTINNICTIFPSHGFIIPQTKNDSSDILLLIDQPIAWIILSRGSLNVFSNCF